MKPAVEVRRRRSSLGAPAAALPTDAGGASMVWLERRRFLAGAGLAVAGLSAGSVRADLVEVIVAAKPSVVAVGLFNPTTSPRFAIRGTGFVVGDGLQVLTNAHVLPEGDPPFGTELRVRVVSGPAAPGERVAVVAAVDRQRDLALLRIDGARLPALRLAAEGEAREGTSVALIGFPIGGVLGMVPVTHRGIISAVTQAMIPPPEARQLTPRGVITLREGPFTIYQLDATAYPGNSGGPLLDARTGEVLGVVNMVLIKGTKESALSQPTGISYAVPSRFAAALLAASAQTR